MAFPPPNTDPQLAGPLRFADQNRRLKQKEGLVLPTPRTYGFSANGNLGTTSGSSPLQIAASSSVWVSPGEMIGVLLTVDVVSSAATTVGQIRITSSSLATVGALPLDYTFGTTRITYAGSPSGGGPSTSGNKYPGGFVWLHPYWDGAAEVGGVSAPSNITLAFHIVRQTGAGNLTAHNLRARIMVV